MPVGDSITYGYQSTDGNGYRLALYNALQKEGHSVDFVGSNRGGNMVDPDNEGWSGYEISGTAAKAEASAPGLQPNVYTVLLGTNDAGNNDNIADAGARYSALLDSLWSITPDATIVMATVPVNGWGSPWEDYVEQINEQLHTIFNNYQAAGKRITFVDFHDGADALVHPTDFADMLHPNNEGYAKMANLWFQGIQRAEAAGFLVPPS